MALTGVALCVFVMLQGVADDDVQLSASAAVGTDALSATSSDLRMKMLVVEIVPRRKIEAEVTHRGVRQA